ncbi:hypothetical protein RMS29_027840 (plasmid) [Agrobacterium rosae]|uniref:Uncharacterized protein n=1 Tax=Agrobacterium rosae TaxID=1972867 RepID=A0AAW9FKZ6_9HYPH|nr:MULTISPECIES: hypothetical protein [Agrobacterium]MDX8321766.1 hypothetical protein [Agrobacterium sp. rho-8.1]MDX8305232.1 hypothetical protein [Agrobacterium rosae]MDX8311513.1 hypothetical protein [Agrobacterium sp. rho-13.3]MDX8316253.1 hypothetical protein [Agrobacterium rosae]MDX8332440.1 hypothetical protein [Agrobacterium rosae]
MKTETFYDNGATITLKHDDEEGLMSSVLIVDPSGVEFDIPVPRLDEQGVPNFNGRPVTLDDLRELALLRTTYGPILQSTSENERSEMAETMGSDLDEEGNYFAWLRLLRQAINEGVFRPHSA